MRNWKTLAIVAVLLSGGLLLGATWNAGYEGSPAGTDLASDLDTFINRFKEDVRKRLGVEHIFGATATDDNGLHTMGSARCFLQNAAPVNISGSGAYNNAADSFDALALSTDEIGATTRDIGAGRCWIDLDGPDNVAGNADDESLAIWNETSNTWVYVVRNFNHGSRVGPYNQIVNGGFEGTDGTGSTASVTVAYGWTNLNTSTIAYINPVGVTEGEGTSIRTTAAGGADEGASQSVANLKASTSYVVQARVKATAGDTCDLQVTGGAATVTATSITSGAFETLQVIPTTTAGPAALVVRLESNLDTDICEWDHVTMYELQNTPPVAQDGIVACRSTSIDNTNNAYNDHNAGSTTFVDALVSCTVNVPGPAYAIVVNGAVHADGDANNTGMEARLREVCNGAAATTVADGFSGGNSNSAVGATDVLTVWFNFIKTTTAPGDTCVYTIEAIGHGDTLDRNMGGAEAGNLDPVEQPVTYVQTLLLPTR